ncbi:MAG TPA: hypothetical protein VK171_00585 [Fimbriimonas sp.]|nr:hypothetical protein [Fimbriimonas sp.]
MSDATKNVLKLIGVLLLIYIGYRLVMTVALLALKVAIPLAIVGAIGYVVYTAATGKSLLGGKRTLP